MVFAINSELSDLDIQDGCLELKSWLPQNEDSYNLTRSAKLANFKWKPLSVMNIAHDPQSKKCIMYTRMVLFVTF